MRPSDAASLSPAVLITEGIPEGDVGPVRLRHAQVPGYIMPGACTHTSLTHTHTHSHFSKVKCLYTHTHTQTHRYHTHAHSHFSKVLAYTHTHTHTLPPAHTHHTYTHTHCHVSKVRCTHTRTPTHTHTHTHTREQRRNSQPHWTVGVLAGLGLSRVRDPRNGPDMWPSLMAQTPEWSGPCQMGLW